MDSGFLVNQEKSNSVWVQAVKLPIYPCQFGSRNVICRMEEEFNLYLKSIYMCVFADIHTVYEWK